MTTTQPVQASQTHAPVMVLLIILVSYFLIVLNNSIIFTGLPRIASEMVMGPAGLSWVQNAYTLVFGGLLLLGARAGDILGRRRVFIAGLVIFAAGSFLIGAALSPVWLIAARAVQGVGAAIVAPISLALVTATIPAGPKRTRAVAAYGATAGIGASLGLLVGGALAEWISWRAGFYLNVPIALVMIVAALRYLPAFRPEPGRFDLLGAMTSTLGMGALVYGIVEAGEDGWGSLSAVVPLALGALVLAAFVVTERRAVQPILPLRVFSSRQRSGAAVSRLLFAGAVIAFFFFTTQYWQGVYGWTPLLAGVAFLPMTLVQFAFSLLVPRLTRRVGTGVLVGAGLLLVLLGLLWLTGLTPTSGYPDGFVPALVLIGLGQGLGFGPLTAAGIHGAREEDAGAASGLVNTAHQLGSTLGVAVLTTAAAGATTLIGQVTAAYAGGAVMLAIALIAALAFVLPADLAARRASLTEQ